MVLTIEDYGINMSHDEHKLKHSKRRHDTYTVIEKRRKLLKDYKIGINCGNPNCVMCMNPRRYGEKTIQELSFEQTAKWSEE